MIVYKATNKINNKVYIGITSQVLQKRINKHKSDANKGSKTSFHRAIRKYGFDNFKWSIEFKCKNRDEMIEREIYLIEKLDSYRSGYNDTLGGDSGSGLFGERSASATISENQAIKIINLITSTEMSLSEISSEVNCSLSVVKDISLGYSWKHLYSEAPTKNRPFGSKRLFIDEEKVKTIINYIINTKLSYDEIAKKTKTTKKVVYNIASGKTSTDLSGGDIRHLRPKGSSRLKISKEKAKAIVKCIIETDKKYSEIAELFDVKESLVADIATGRTWKELYEENPCVTRKLNM